MQLSAFSPPTQQLPVVIRLEDPLLRTGVLATLRDDARFAARADLGPRAGTAPCQLASTDSTAMEVVIADYETGLTVAAAAKGPGRPQRVMIVTHRGRESEIRLALELGVLGYVVVGSRVDEVVSCLLAVQRGIRYLGASAAQRIADSFTYQKLTGREGDVLKLIVAGMSNKMIARDLAIAEGTVKAHIKSILEKLDAKNRTQAAVEARRRGLFEGEDRAEPARPLWARSALPDHAW